jgi:glycosyltransferase involved in cell wall biosynthesis
MNIAVNLRQYFKGKIGGLENYVRHVLGGVARDHARKNRQLTIFADPSEAKNIREFAPAAVILPVSRQSAATAIAAELETGKYDLFFCPLLVLEPLTPQIPSAVMIPDLQHEFLPEFFDAEVLRWRRQTYQPSAFRADIVFTLSEHAKTTLVDKFGISQDKIQVIYLDVDEEFRAPALPACSDAFRALELPKDYLYFPANFWPHKNHSNLFRAMQMLQKRYPELALVLTGAPSSGAGRIDTEIAQLGLRKCVRILGYQERSVTVELYRHARALVFPSKFEGFGIPLLEAFHTGTPVVSSSACSLPEVAGDAALLINEDSPESIAAGVCRILDDHTLRNALIEKGIERARGYSWSRAVDLTLEWFDRITHTSSARQVHVSEYPFVSIVTPSFNMGRFLEETIQSVLGQGYPNIEYIVMDGGSSDSTVEILRRYEGKLRYQTQPDRGQANAINRGFAASSGQIFAFLNADDTYLPGAVATAVRHLLDHRSAGAIYGEAYYVREDGSIIDRYPTRPFDYEFLNRNCFICQPATFMWRSAFAASGAMNEGLHYALDYDLWIRMAKRYPFVKVDDYLATSRMHAANKTLGSRGRVFMEILSLAKTHYRYVPFDWVFGYASYLLDRHHQFFEPTRASSAKYLLSLLLGCYYNRTQMRRYGKDWATRLEIGSEFTGRWADGWISKRYVSSMPVPDDCESIRLEGKHLAPLRAGLTLTMRLNGQPIEKTHVREHGPFAITAKCPLGARGKDGVVEIESSRTFRPFAGGDYRKLSCIIDAVRFR